MTTANTGPLTLFPAAASTMAPFTVTANVSVGSRATVTVSARKISASDLESAIYAHIQAVRALGKTKIAPEEIARALELPLSTVERSLSALQSKGVKVVYHG